MKHRFLWIVWLLLTTLLALAMVVVLLSEETDKTMFLPGQTSDGHFQIELACTACHSESFADRNAVQAACEGCHAEPLKAARDIHPKSKFTDPRNADRLAVLDARYCVTCHVEHRPDITHEMGVTVPRDVCYLCHATIAEDRPSHEGMEFSTCANAGCHNFHDNQALYEDFLIKHIDEQDTFFGRQQPTSNLLAVAGQLPGYPLESHPLQPVAMEQQDLPANVSVAPHIVADWLASSHAAAGVNCIACHSKEDATAPAWENKPDHRYCAGCHQGEVSGFLSGKHGMRLDEQRLGRVLTPMTPALARLPVKQAALQSELDCQSCHGAHRYDSATAQMTSCLSCHDDDHSLAYEGSPHHQLWQQEQAGNLPAGSGVSCAGCHMPRIEKDYFWGTFTHNEVQHNQSANLRPNEKMIRPVCMSCHGLEFALDALADEALIHNNFSGKPAVHVESTDLARRRLEAQTTP